ncbi:MAG: metallophosphoesterase family protein [Chloroflexi bacterium]|nr:metallophosphoesterase family protein [Chloroflexota bacterium]
MKILALSDQVVERLYTLSSSGHFQGVSAILGCGDMPYEYLEYLVTVLNAPMFYVPGNHDPKDDPQNRQSRAEGGINLDLKTARHNKFLIGGFGGSIQYRPDGVNQYTQSDAYLRAFTMLPRLIANRLQYGRTLDILISHSPPFGIHDDADPAHQGLKAINWLMRVAKPRYHFHGHTHIYKRNIENTETTIGLTKIVNVYPYLSMEVSH